MKMESLDEKEYLDKLYKVYKENKDLFIRAEECLKEMGFFVAPLIEHRDALDHIMRYFSLKSQGDQKSDLENKSISELDKALNHEIRAFFDISDYICIVVRDEINKGLKKLTPSTVKKIWSSYLEVKKRIVNVSDEISKIRQSRRGSFEDFERYKSVINELFDIYSYYYLSIEPLIHKKLF